MTQPQYPQKEPKLANVDPIQLIVTAIHFARRRQEFAWEDYNKAVLNHNNSGLQIAHEQMNRQIGIVLGLTTALRYTLAAQADLSGRRVSESMSEFDDEIESLIGNDL